MYELNPETKIFSKKLREAFLLTHPKAEAVIICTQLHISRILHLKLVRILPSEVVAKERLNKNHKKFQMFLVS